MLTPGLGSRETDALLPPAVSAGGLASLSLPGKRIHQTAAMSTTGNKSQGIALSAHQFCAEQYFLRENELLCPHGNHLVYFRAPKNAFLSIEHGPARVSARALPMLLRLSFPVRARLRTRQSTTIRCKNKSLSRSFEWACTWRNCQVHG